MLQVKLVKPTSGNSCLIPLTQGKSTLVDPFDLAVVLPHKWIAILWNFRWYAYSYKLKDGTPCRVAMHRLIAKTPIGEVCHHLNKNSLDNRGANLLNQTPRHHRELHGIRKFGRKSQSKTTIRNGLSND